MPKGGLPKLVPRRILGAEVGTKEDDRMLPWHPSSRVLIETNARQKQASHAIAVRFLANVSAIIENPEDGTVVNNCDRGQVVLILDVPGMCLRRCRALT